MALALMQQQQQSRAGLLLGGTHSLSCSGPGSVHASQHGLHALKQRHVRSPGLHTKVIAAPGSSTVTPPRQPQPGGTPPHLYSEGECIEVEESFEPSEGARLSQQLMIDKAVGSGSTADVYKVKRVTAGGSGGGGGGGGCKQAGQGQVLKWSKPLPGAAKSTQREWMLGRPLNAAARQDPALRILLQTGWRWRLAAAQQGAQLVFRGTLLQGLKGKSLDKRLEEDGSFCDIDFIVACLEQVLTAVDRGHDLVGFRHGDLRISNIMEDIADPDAYEALLSDPDTWRARGYDSPAAAALDAGILRLKLLDWGHSEIHESRSRAVLLAAQASAAASAAAADNGNGNGTASSGGAFSSSPSGAVGRQTGAKEEPAKRYEARRGGAEDGGGDEGQGPPAEADPYIVSGGDAAASLALQRLPPAKGIVEAIYTFFYKGKSDPWRLLHSLAPRVDGRAWPERRAGRVLALYALLDEVLGTKLEAKFFCDTEEGPDGQLRRLGSNERVPDPAGSGSLVKVNEAPALDVTARPRRWHALKWLRDVVLRLGSRLFSRRPRVSAREVLAKMRARGLLPLPARGGGGGGGSGGGGGTGGGARARGGGGGGAAAGAS